MTTSQYDTDQYISEEDQIEAYYTWLYEIIGYYVTRPAMMKARDEALTRLDVYREEEARQEAWAENAWLRAAEAGTPDSWAEEDYERMVAAVGYGSPYGGPR